MNTRKHWELPLSHLYNKTDLSKLKFKTTDELKISDEFIAQNRAISSLNFGLDLDYKGYNIFVSGDDGTGKLSTVRTILEHIAPMKHTPNDWCYIHNFDHPERPIAIELPRGSAKEFKKDMQVFVDGLLKEIPAAFESKDYEDRINDIMKFYGDKKNNLFSTLEEMAKEHNFAIKVTKVNVVTIPIIEGKQIDEHEYAKLDKNEKDRIEKEREKINEEIVKFLREIRVIDRKMQEQIESVQKQVALMVADGYLNDLVEKYEKEKEVIDYLAKVKNHVLDNLNFFLGFEDPNANARKQPQRKKTLTEYEVNVLVDNTDTSGAPIVFENNPTYFNVFGKLEKRIEYGFYTADFSMIRSGSLLKANGGYLIVQAMDLLMNFQVWNQLKRVLKNREIILEDPLEEHGLIATTGFKPEPIPLNVKVIMVGSADLYYLLYHHDEDFHNIFKVKADFDYEMPKSKEFIEKYASFIATRCKENKLKHFTKEAVGRIIEYSSRLIEDQNRLSAQFGKINDLIVEANFFAKNQQSKYVDLACVEKAITEKRARVKLPEEKMLKYIHEGDLMINVEGKAVGELNALSVLNYGDFEFGRPSKITARTFHGKSGLINIERESKLSGKLHDKGVLILNGYFGWKYGQNKPVSLSASLCFEQSYGMIDGDSASSTEFYALLSSLSGVPIQQSIAVTGSMNQRGEVQPIGGVNSKVEGFFDVCKLRGLDGSHGVMIPKHNVKNLMLKEEVVEAVKKKKFHIYAVETVDDGIEVLTGVPAGKMKKDGSYPAKSIHSLVQKTLESFGKEPSKKRKKKSK